MFYDLDRQPLADGYTPVPSGKIVTVVTELEMRERPSRLRDPLPGWTVARVRGDEVERYLAVYRAIGERWMWFSRLAIPRERLAAALDDPTREAWIASRDGRDMGLFELDRSREAEGAVEVAMFGLVAEATGQGAGGWLMGEAIRRGFGPAVRRFWLHTCDLDDPRALGFYRHSGFRPCGRSVEVADDPRLTGAVPRGTRPDIPVIEG
jgi:GNAT superfamily N-acetyltransferase